MTQEEFKEEALKVRPQLLEVARRYLGDADAEDVVQDTLLRLWQMVADVRRPMYPLASRLTRNLCIDHLRRLQRVTHDASLSGEADEPLEARVSDGSPVGEDTRIERMMKVVETLPSLQQTIIRLRHIEGMEMKDIAAIIGSNEVAIRKALSRARQTVRQQYLKQYER